jgi:hypothetical protein
MASSEVVVECAQPQNAKKLESNNGQKVGFDPPRHTQRVWAAHVSLVAQPFVNGAMTYPGPQC